jgi:hypothetical protein
MAWTNELPWTEVVSILDHGGVADGDFELSTGTDNTAALHAAIADLGANGGTVYFPSGTYFFADNLFLPNNIILRGETPQNADAKTASFDPPTNFVFPKYEFDPAANGGSGTDIDTAFKSIFPGDQATETVNAQDAHHIGLVWIDLNRASINLDGADRIPGGGNYSARVPVENYTSTHQLAFGVRVNNSAKAMGAEFFNSGVPIGFQEAWQRWPWRFNASIRMASAYATISNCRIHDLCWASTHNWGRATGDPEANYLNDNFIQPGFKDRGGVTMQRDGLTTFRHSNQYGVSINGLYHFDTWYATEATAPWLYKPGISIRDNFIYNTFGAKLEASGSDLLIAGNVFRGAPDKAGYISPVGDAKMVGSSFTSRACLMGGRNIRCYENDVQVYRSRILKADGSPEPYLSNDGENFMVDNTTSMVDGFYVINNRVVSNIFAFKTKDIRNMRVINNWWYPKSEHRQANVGESILIEADINNNPNYSLNNVIVRNNRQISGSCSMIGSKGGAGNEFVDNSSDGASQLFRHTMDPPLDLFIEGNTGFNLSPQAGNP